MEMNSFILLFEDSKLFVLVVLVFILVVGLGFVVVVVHQCTLFVTLLISNSILYSQSSKQSPPTFRYFRNDILNYSNPPNIIQF